MRDAGIPLADLETRVEDGALWLTLNRPEVYNALTDAMADELAAVDRAGDRPTTRSGSWW